MKNDSNSNKSSKRNNPEVAQTGIKNSRTRNLPVGEQLPISLHPHDESHCVSFALVAPHQIKMLLNIWNGFRVSISNP